ncbi:MAG: sulfatase-like hydrolase/transferase, partial [Spirochaetales bacterium]|nr:sulfatase-like hydrolase/transferase [Spirochaetales bacterium]
KAYTAAPLCAPARVSMLTGRYPGAHGVRSNPALKVGAKYSKDLIDVMGDAGYTTAMIGKNHSHLSVKRVDHWFALGHAAGYGNEASRRSEQEDAFDTWLHDLCHGVAEAPSPFPLECQGPHRMVTDAGEWLDTIEDDNPFFLWLSFAEPHNPYQVPEPYFSMFPEKTLPPAYGSSGNIENGFKWEFLSKMERMAMPRYDELLPRMRSNYYGMLRLIDDQVHRFTDILKSAGRYSNTIFFYVSDHGDFVGDYDLMRKGPEMPESLMRIPFGVWGSQIASHQGPHPAHVNLVDIMPSVCGLLGGRIPEGVQGRDLSPLLRNEAYPDNEFSSAYAEQGFGGLDYSWDDNIDFEKCMPPAITFDCLNQYSQSGTMRMIRKGKWKLLYDMQGDGRLYDLDLDPGELENLYSNSKHIGIRTELLEELLIQTLRAADPLPYPGGIYERKTHPRNYWTDPLFKV